MHIVSAEKIRGSNPKCSIRNTVLTDRSDPVIRIELSNGQNVIYNTVNLTELEIFQHLKKCQSRLEEEPEAKVA